MKRPLEKLIAGATLVVLLVVEYFLFKETGLFVAIWGSIVFGAFAILAIAATLPDQAR